MKVLNIATTLTHISDMYIAEAADMPYETSTIPREKRRSGFMRFINSPAGVAILCALVAVAVTVGIIAAGQAAGPITTLPGAGPTHPTFAFAYEIEPEQDTFHPGETFTIRTEVTNLGVPFSISGSSCEFSASAWLVPHGTEDVYDHANRISGLFAYTDDYVIQTVDQGDVGTHSGSFTVPEDATAGDYDLVLAYKGEYQVFEKALTVATDTAEDIEIVYLPHLSKGKYARGETVVLDFMVNRFDPPSVDSIESGMPLRPSCELSAVLVPHGKDAEDPSAIAGTVEWDFIDTPVISALNWVCYSATFVIPTGAWEGVYDLILRYAEEGAPDTVTEKREENVLTVSGDTCVFAFSYELEPAESSYYPGDPLRIITHITNTGIPFTITGSSQAFSAEAKLVHHYDPETVILCEFSYDDDYVTQEIATGQTGQHRGYLTIPADAAVGDYDIWLYYGDEYQVFERAVTVKAPTEAST